MDEKGIRPPPNFLALITVIYNSTIIVTGVDKDEVIDINDHYIVKMGITLEDSIEGIGIESRTVLPIDRI